MHTPSSERPFIIRPVPGMYFTTYNRDMGEITMEPAYRGIEEETVTRLPSKAFDEFLKARSGDVLDGSGCGRRAHLRAAAASCAGRRETRTSAV